MKAGVCTIALRDRTLDEAIEVIARTGAESIELWGRPPHLPELGDLVAIERIRKHLRDAGVALGALGSYYRPDVISDDDGMIRSKPAAADEESASHVLEAAVRLQAPLIRVWAGTRNYEEYTEEERAVVMRQLIEFTNRASEEGLAVCIERHSNTLTNGWDTAATVIEEIRREVEQPHLVGACYQVPYPEESGKLVSRFREDLRRLLPPSRHCHMQNYTLADPSPRDHRYARALLERGILDYGELGRIAREVGYSDSVMVEFAADERGQLSVEEALAADVAFVASL